MIAFKDLFPRAYEVLAQDAELLKDSEKRALQKLLSCQQSLDSIREFFRDPAASNLSKALSTCRSPAGPVTPVKTKLDEKKMNVLLAQTVLKKIVDADIVMNTIHPKPNPPDPAIKYPADVNIPGLYIGKFIHAVD